MFFFRQKKIFPKRRERNKKKVTNLVKYEMNLGRLCNCIKNVLLTIKRPSMHIDMKRIYRFLYSKKYDASVFFMNLCHTV